jgi:hypothetical protein
VSRRKRKENGTQQPDGTQQPASRPDMPPMPLPAAAPPVLPVTVEALAAQAQALEGVRRLHIDLADRLAAGEALRGRVDRVSDGLDALRSDQADLRRTLDRPRGGRVGILLMVLIVGMAGGVWAWERWADSVPWLKDWRRGGAPVSATRGEGLTHIASLAGDDRPPVHETRAEEPQAPLPGPTATDDRELRDRELRAEELLESARAERNKQLGENARLRQELIEQQLRMDDLMKTVGDVAASAEQRRVKPVVTSRSSDREPAPLVTRVNEALLASGLEDIQLVEAGGIEGDSLTDLLVRELDRPTGSFDIYPMKSARLSVHDGLVSLVFTAEPEALGRSGESTAHVLTEWNEAAWIAVGFPVPTGFVPVNVALDALRHLLSYHPYEVVSLGGFQTGELRDVVLAHVTSDGEVLRTFSAPRANVLAEGPELVLHDGVVTEGGIDRPFWHGQSRLPLPGSSFAAWVEVIGG